MDALLRLRVLIWALLLSLWAVMVYQYLGDEEEDGAMRQITNPYLAAPGRAAQAPLPGMDWEPPASPAPAVPHPAAPEPEAPARAPAALPASGAPAPAAARPPAPEPRATGEPPRPAGFTRAATPHFIVFSEDAEAPEQFLELLEALHSNLMLDLAPFSPWAREERVAVYLFKSQSAYRRLTGRPSWSGGASSVARRKVYVYESEELPGILAHELTHIYFDAFFLGAAASPLWLSEGMATLVQVERGLAAPNWLRENLRLLEGGEGFDLDAMAAQTGTSGWSDERVRLWYAQAYSVVRFLLRAQYRSSFYKFASHLRDGRPPAEALYRAYGAPYSRLKALEYAWRHELARASGERAPR